MKNYEVGAPFDVHHSLFLVQYSNPAGGLRLNNGQTVQECDATKVK